MVIDPSILKKIKRVVFTNNEPMATNVLWAKPVGQNTYSFYIFYEGDWHPTDEITNITISDISGDISAFNNDVGYLTETELQQSLGGYYTKTQADGRFLTEHQSLMDYALKEEIPSIDGLASEQWVRSQGYLTQHQDLAAYATKQDVDDRFEELVGAAPKDLDTLEEIAEQLGKDEDAVAGIVTTLGNKADKDSVYSKSEADGKFITEHQSLSGYATENWVEGQGYLKQHQSLEAYALKSELFSGSYKDLSDKPNIPTKTSELTNDSGFLTSHQDISNLATKAEVIAVKDKIPTKVSELSNDAGYLTAHQDISGKANASDVYLKTDADARFEKLKKIDGTLYVGVGNTAQEVAVAGNVVEDIHEEIPMNAKRGYLFVIFPESNAVQFSMLLSGISIPVNKESNITLSGVSYEVYKSANTYYFSSDDKIVFF